MTRRVSRGYTTTMPKTNPFRTRRFRAWPKLCRSVLFSAIFLTLSINTTDRAAFMTHHPRLLMLFAAGIGIMAVVGWPDE